MSQVAKIDDNSDENVFKTL